MLDFLDILEKYGPVAGCFAALAVFVLRDWRRIEHLEKRIEALESDYKSAVTGMLARCESTLSETNKLFHELLLNR